MLTRLSCRDCPEQQGAKAELMFDLSIAVLHREAIIDLTNVAETPSWRVILGSP